jgi:hypothetical protein
MVTPAPGSQRKRTAIACLLWSVVVVSASPKSWTLYHATISDSTSLDPAFVPRGRIQLSLKSDEEIDKPVVKEQELYTLTIEHESDVLTADWTKSLLQDDALYQLKLVSDDTPDAVPILTTIPACQLRRANFRCVFFSASATLFDHVLFF